MNSLFFSFSIFFLLFLFFFFFSLRASKTLSQRMRSKLPPFKGKTFLYKLEKLFCNVVVLCLSRFTCVGTRYSLREEKSGTSEREVPVLWEREGCFSFHELLLFERFLFPKDSMRLNSPGEAGGPVKKLEGISFESVLSCARNHTGYDVSFLSRYKEWKRLLLLEIQRYDVSFPFLSLFSLLCL